MGFVNLVSGGLDSTLVGVMAKEDGMEQYPLFIDYGQIAAKKEWETCQALHRTYDLPEPIRMNLSGFGHVIVSGLTNQNLDVAEEAFTPCRNFMFLIMASAYAYQLGLSAISIGLLSEQFSLFPDQRISFIEKAEDAIEAATGRRIKVLLPLIDFTKSDVVHLAKQKFISGTYSCHVGNDVPCGYCIACKEYGIN